MFGIHESQQTHKDCHGDGCSGREGAKAYLRDILELSKDKRTNILMGDLVPVQQQREEEKSVIESANGGGPHFMDFLLQGGQRWGMPLNETCKTHVLF